MIKKIVISLLFVSFNLVVHGQSLTLKKGAILENVIISDSISESFSLYLPTNFEVTKKWPVVFVFDSNGRGKQAVQMFMAAAEKNGYILAAPNNINDSLKIEENVLVTSRMMNRVFSILPIEGRQIYTAGFSDSAKFASLLPVFITTIQGVLSINGSLANTDILNSKKMFHYIGVIDVNDYNLKEMQSDEKVLNALRYPNQLFVYNQMDKPTVYDYINTSLEIFTISAMAKNSIPLDSSFINEKYQDKVGLIQNLINQNRLVSAYDLTLELMEVYRGVCDISDLKNMQKSIRKNRAYKSMKQTEAAVAFNESLKREDYDYAMYEDIASYNFNNLGWWKYQKEELERQNSKDSMFKLQMNNRLKGFINFLVDKNTLQLQAEKEADEEGLVLLGMLKTITNPKDFEGYKRVISLSSKNEDYSTALFYLEELLKVGFTDTKALYEIEHTGLLRIAPEFNEIVEKYLKDARYTIDEQ